MAEIRGGVYTPNETNGHSMGGTERLTMELANRIEVPLLQEFQIVSSRVRELQEDKIRIFWAHDLPNDPESKFLSDKNQRDKFHLFVFVSNWQMQKYMDRYDLPWSKCIVMLNAIDPIESHEKPDNGELNLIYYSTPHRGLNVLVPVFEKLCERYDNINLDVYSSFKLYGWEERDKEYSELFERIENHPKMTNHGTVSNEEIREALKQSHILAYPSVWPETSCMVLMEAMSAGLVCVHSNYAALYETAANWTQMYQLQESPSIHAGMFYSMLCNVIDNYKGDTIQTRIPPMQGYANIFYSWKLREQQWTSLLKSMLESVEDRSFPKEVFSYKTA